MEKYPLILRVCRRYLRDHTDADDAAQSMVVKLLKLAPTVNSDVLDHWLAKVAHNHCLDILKQKRRTDLPLEEVEYLLQSQEEDPFAYAQRQERLGKLWNCLEKNVKDPQQQSIIRQRAAGETNADIAKQLNCDPRQVGKDYNLAIKNLKNAIERAQRARSSKQK